MSEEGIHIETLPELEKPILIVGFGGWGNALDIATGMVAYLIRTFKADSFARLISVSGRRCIIMPGRIGYSRLFDSIITLT